MRVEIRFYRDRDTGVAHLEMHHVSESEAADVIRRPLENLPSDRNSRILIGRTRAGRLLKLVCVFDADGQGVFVVTAFDLVGKPLRAHQRRMRKRGRR